MSYEYPSVGGFVGHVPRTATGGGGGRSGSIINSSYSTATTGMSRPQTAGGTTLQSAFRFTGSQPVAGYGTASERHRRGSTQSRGGAADEQRPRTADTSNRRASLLSVASSISRLSFSRGSSGRQTKVAAAAVVPEVIEISSGYAEEQDREREQLREMAARAVGIVSPEPTVHERHSSDETDEPVTPGPIPYSSSSPAIAPANRRHLSGRRRSNTLDDHPPIPQFPAPLSSLPVQAIQKKSTAPIPKYYPPSRLRVFRGKGWKSRTLALTHEGNAKWFLHVYRGDTEAERLEINHTSFISIADEEVAGRRGGVIAVGGEEVGLDSGKGAAGQTIWHFYMPDSKEAQQWINEVKSAVLALRTLRSNIPLPHPSLPSPTFFSTSHHTSGNGVSPASPVGDMDTVLSMRKQGLLNINNLSPTRSTFSQEEKSTHARNSNSLSSRDSSAQFPSAEKRDKGAVQALKTLFTSSTNGSSGRPKSADGSNTAKDHWSITNRPRSPSAATSIRSFLSSPDEGEENGRSSGGGFMSGWGRSTSPPPPLPATKRLPISGTSTPVNVKSHLDRKIQEAPSSAWASPPGPSSQTPSLLNEPPEFTHPFATGGTGDEQPISTAAILERVNKRASAAAMRGGGSFFGGSGTGLQPPPRRSLRSSNGMQSNAPSSFKDEGRKMTLMTNPSLTGLGGGEGDRTTGDNLSVSERDPSVRSNVNVSTITLSLDGGDEKHAKDPLLSSQKSTPPPPPSMNGTPPSTVSSSIPIPASPTASENNGFMPSLTPPSNNKAAKRFSRQGASTSSSIPSARPPPTGPLPQAPTAPASPTSSSGASTFASRPAISLDRPGSSSGSNGDVSHAQKDDADRERPAVSRRLSPGDVAKTNGNGARISPRPTSIAISVSSYDPGEEPTSAGSPSSISFVHHDRETDEGIGGFGAGGRLEEEEEEQKSIVSTLPTFNPNPKRLSGGSAFSLGRMSVGSSGGGGGGGRDSFESSTGTGRDSFGNPSQSQSQADNVSLNGGAGGSIGRDSFGSSSLRAQSPAKGHRTSMPPPQRPAPSFPPPPAPASPQQKLRKRGNSLSEDANTGSPTRNGSSSGKRLSVLSAASASESSLESGAGGGSQRRRSFRDRAFRLSSIHSAPKPPPTVGLPDVPPPTGGGAGAGDGKRTSRSSSMMSSNPLPPPAEPLPPPPPSPPPQDNANASAPPPGRSLSFSKRLRILSTPNTNTTNAPPIPPRSTARPSTQIIGNAILPPGTPPPHDVDEPSSFLQLQTPITPNISHTHPSSSSSIPPLPVLTETVALSPPPRRGSWGNNRNFSKPTTMTTTTTSDNTTPTSSITPVNGTNDNTTTTTISKDDGEENKPRSQRSSVISLRIQV